MRKTRDVGVELARVVACLIVIGVHVKLPSLVESSYDYGRILISCILSDGVALFWFISGFFLFESTSYQRALRRMLTHVLAPAFAVGMVSFLLQGVLRYGILGAVQRPVSDYLHIAWGILCWENPFELAPHLWYVFAYALVILGFPLLKLFSDYLCARPQRERTFLLVVLALLGINDLTRNATLEFSHHGLAAAVPAAIEMICGRIVYRHRVQLTKRMPLTVVPLVFLATNALRAAIQLHDYQIDSSVIHLSRWYSVAALICVLCIFHLCFSWDQRTPETKSRRIVVTLGSYTFPVYLVHYLVVGFFDTLGIPKLLQYVLPLTEHGVLSFACALAYTAVMTTLVGLVSLSICVALRHIRTLLTHNNGFSG